MSSDREKNSEEDEDIDELDPIIAAFSPEEIEEDKELETVTKKHILIFLTTIISIDNQKMSEHVSRS